MSPTSGDGVNKDKWFVAMLAIIICLLGGIGTLVIILNSQTWNKLDRISALFLHERDLINSNTAKLQERINCLEKDHYNDMRLIEGKINHVKK